MNELIILRKLMRDKRNALTKKNREDASQKLLNNFKKLKNIDNYKAIGMYYAFDGEIGLENIIHYCWAENKKCFLSVINNYETKKLIFCECSPQTKFIKNKFHIPEPHGEKCVEADVLDLILLPLTAFDKTGHRLGMGQGYYDRTLAQTTHMASSQKRPLLVGVGYAFQEVEQLTPHAHDVKLDAVMTEEGILLF